MANLNSAIVAVLPALIVMARFLVPGDWNSEMTWFFAQAGLAATFIGSIVPAVFLRRRIAKLPVYVALGVSVTIAVLLLAIFSTMPSWPFTGIGFIVIWVLLAAGLTLGFTYVAICKYA